MMNLPIPDFRTLDSRIDDRLNEILHRALARDLDQRYPDGRRVLYDLEHYIYHSGYGPTNETLGKYIRDLFGNTPWVSAGHDNSNMEHTQRITPTQQTGS